MSDTTFSMSTPASATTEHGHRRVLPTMDLAAVAGLASIIAIHATELGGKVDVVAYLGAGYVALIAAAFVAVVMFAEVGETRRDRGAHLREVFADHRCTPLRRAVPALRTSIPRGTTDARTHRTRGPIGCFRPVMRTTGE